MQLLLLAAVPYVLDNTAKVLGTVMLVLIAYVAFSTNPPVGTAVTHAIVPTNYPWLATITLIGGTVGGYITFSGGHRLIDAGITGQEHLKDVRRAVTREVVKAVNVPVTVKTRLGDRRAPRHTRQLHQRNPL